MFIGKWTIWWNRTKIWRFCVLAESYAAKWIVKAPKVLKFQVAKCLPSQLILRVASGFTVLCWHVECIYDVHFCWCALMHTSSLSVCSGPCMRHFVLHCCNFCRRKVTISESNHPEAKWTVFEDAQLSLASMLFLNSPKRSAVSYGPLSLNSGMDLNYMEEFLLRVNWCGWNERKISLWFNMTQYFRFISFQMEGGDV